MKLRLTSVSVLLLAAANTYGQITIAGADGSDGALDCAALYAINAACGETCGTLCSVEIDLGLAAGDTCGPGGDETCTKDHTSPVAGRGIYDAEQWAVIFKYTLVDIPETVTVTFKNHGSRAPVMWLVSGTVTIAGTVNLDGNDGHSTSDAASYAEPGAGGFRGGRGQRSTLSFSGGFGPGGASLGGKGGATVPQAAAAVARTAILVCFLS